MQRFAVALALLLSSACTVGHDTADAAIEQAQEALRAGNPGGALAATERAISRLSDADESDLAWRLRLVRADTFIARRDFEQAQRLLQKTVPAAIRMAAIRARQRYLAAKLAFASNDLPRAVTLVGEARALAPDDQDVQIDLDVLEGGAQLLQRAWEPAEAALGRGLERARQRGDDYRALLCLNNLGMCRLGRGHYDEALTFFERALALSKLEKASVYGQVLSNSGICYSRLGQFDRALEVQRRAVSLLRERGAAKPLVEALGSLGNTYVLKGDARGSLPFLNEAFSVANAGGLRRDAATWAVNLSAANAAIGDWPAAERFNESSRAIADPDAVRQVYVDLNAAQIAAGRGGRAGARTLYERALAEANGVPAVTWTAHAALAQLAVDDQQPVVAAEHFKAALATVEKTRSDLLKLDYRLSFLTELIEFYRNYVDALVAQNRSDEALAIADSSRGRVLAERQRVDAPANTDVPRWREVARRTHTVLLSYWLAPRRSFLWIVDGAGVRRIDLPPQGQIEAALREHRAMLANALVDPLQRADTPGDRLFRMLVAPAALPAGASVVIVPDGALYELNFETLPVDGGRRHYWIEDAEVQIAPSLSTLTARAAVRTKAPRLLLIGNPVPRPPEFPRLGHASTEMRGIVSHFPGQYVEYDEANATPAAYRDAPLDRFSMIHFTAHATANVESPLESAVVLSGPDTGYKLYARDVADKPLDAELVTVSACRSAGERTYSGEGLVGFAWAFLRAGARRVIAGLWDVDDRSTARLMDELYAGLQAGRRPAGSLREAKLALIREGGQLANPYYWGPFQLFTTVP
jgi:CHAT domain-containing protein/Tfp pilus assembly protein PilF